MAGPALDRRIGTAGLVVAGPEHDEAMRRLLRDNPMPGAISLSLEREPDYFHGANIGGATDRTILVFDRDRLACMGRCSFREGWVNGRRERLGYLGELRMDKFAQGRFDLLRRGYRFFHQLQQDEAPACYYTSIATDNLRARQLLESGLKGLPAYEFLGGFVTVVVAVPARPRIKKMNVVTARPGQADEIAGVLNAHALRHELATAWTGESLLSLARHGLPLERFRLMMEGNRIVACGALWDQRAFRQTVIRGYAPALSAARPLINFASRWIGTPRLPIPGSVLGLAFLSPLAFAEGSEAMLPDFTGMFFPLAAQHGIEFLTLGLPENDVRLKVIRRRFSTRIYRSRLYRVSWKGDASENSIPRAGSFFPDLALM